MEENRLRLSGKELFYSAVLLGLKKLVNIQYDFPTDEAQLAKELNEVKRALHKRRLLRENSRNEITLDFQLSACAALCAQPDSCSIVDTGGVSATIYRADDAFMLLEREADGMYAASWFTDKSSLDEHLVQRTEQTAPKEASEEAGINGGT
jgi:hypothetical protein